MRSKSQDTKKSIVMILVMLEFVFLLSLSTNFIIGSKSFGHDSGIFAYIGYAITQGKTLYTEAWDNKGPLLYFIDALGILINYNIGIYILELITLFCSMFMLYKTACLFVSQDLAFPCAVLSMLSLTQTLQRGNLAEEYALPFTILCFYYIAKFFKNDYKIKKYELVIAGMCVSAVFLIRLNILAFLGCAVLGVIIALVKNKDYKMLWNVLFFAFIGFALFAAPFVIYLASRGALKACIDYAYLGILGSFSDISMFERIINVTRMVTKLAPSGTLFILTAFVFGYPYYYKKKKSEKSPFDYLCLISVFGIITTFLANSVSGADHPHYFMCFVPTLIIPTVWFMKIALGISNKVKKDRFKKQIKNILCFTLVIVMCFSCLPGFLMDDAVNNIIVSTTERAPSRAEKVVKYIDENSNPSDTVQVIGDATAVTANYASRRLSGSQHFYYSNGRFSEEYKTEFAVKILEDITENQPKIIMFSTKNHIIEDFYNHCGNPEGLKKFLSENYETVENDFDYLIYQHI